MFGEKSEINGVDIAYGLSWDSSKIGKCNVEVVTPQGSVYGNGKVEFGGLVSLAAYVCGEVESGIFLWETERVGKWVIIGVSSGILAPNSDAVIEESEIIQSVEDMRDFVDADIVHVIGAGTPELNFETYDSSNLEGGPRLVAKKVSLKLIVVVIMVIAGIGGNYGYGEYKDKQARLALAEQVMLNAKMEAERNKKLEKDIRTVSLYDTPLNNGSIIKGIFKIKNGYEGWSLSSFIYPESIGVFKKSKYSYLNNLVNRFGDKVSWNDKGTVAKIKFNDFKPSSPFPFREKDVFYMDASNGSIYDISVLQRLNNLGYATAFKSIPPDWSSLIPSYPEKYSVMFLRVSGGISKIKSVMNLFDKFGYITGKVFIDKEKGLFELELAHYTLANK